MRRIASMLIIVCILLTGCAILKNEKDYKAVSRKLLRLSSYTCDVTMRVTNNKSTIEYKQKHYYKSPDKYKVEILAPQELAGQVQIYDGKSSYIYHPGIEQLLVAENFQASAEYNAFMGSFLELLGKGENVKTSKEEINGRELITAEFEVQKPNRYMRLEKLWIDADAAVPVKAQIYGDDGRLCVEFIYDNFVCNPGLKDGDFKFIQKIQ